MADRSLTLYLVRHPQSALNAAQRLAGSTETPLTPVGHQQARLLADRLARVPLGRVYTSPQSRCRIVADLVAGGRELSPRVLHDLREAEMGEWEGRGFDELAQLHPQARELWRSDPAFRPPGGESALDVWDRAAAALQTIVADGPGAALVVSHGLTLRSLVGVLAGYPRDTAWSHYPFRFLNAGLSLAEVVELAWPLPRGSVALYKLNDTRHLPDEHDA